jgi:hypothetical protein
MHLIVMYFITGNGMYFDYTGNWFPYLEIRPYYQTVIMALLSFAFIISAYYIKKSALHRYAKISTVSISLAFSAFLFYLSGQYISVYKDGMLRLNFSLLTVQKLPIENFNTLKNKCFDFSNFNDSVWWGNWPCSAQSECLFKQITDPSKETFFSREYSLGNHTSLKIIKGFGDLFVLNYTKTSFKSMPGLKH